MNLLAAMRYLVALDKHKHFGRAAQACHITQPALSNALRALEDEFGVAIIKRSRTYGGVTHEGEAVLETARRMLREVELLTQELESTAESPRGALRLAAVPTAMPLLTVFAAMLRILHPGLVPTMLAMSSPGYRGAVGGFVVGSCAGGIRSGSAQRRPFQELAAGE